MNIVLVLPISDKKLLPEFVESCLRDKVGLVAIFGADAHRVEDEIDWLVVGDGSDESRFVCTTSHVDESLAEVTEFATKFQPNTGDSAKVVHL